RALSWAGVLLSRHPEQRQKLLDDPGKIMNAVEELIRFEPPTPIQARYVTRDVEWYGVTVPKDSRIAFLNGSAGRDERQYENPDMFDVDRKTPLRHLSFGFGTHICLGASLARLEMRVVLDELLKRYPSWHVDESRVKLVHTTTVRGPATVPVTV
ncbi:MAG: cytochrome P450, partial [Bacteroidales bacterium]|nr:cytochrome P450 [Bacteroidales bacterium]